MTLQSLGIDNSNSLSNCPSLPESVLQANRDELDIKLNITNLLKMQKLKLAIWF